MGRRRYEVKRNNKIILNMPIDSCELVESFSKINGEEWYIENPSLFYQKVIPPPKSDDNKKKEHLEKFIKAVSGNNEIGMIIEGYCTRINKIIEKFENRQYKCSKFTAKTNWRMVIGLGGANVLETDITFHRYGFPYIPASAIKGNLAHYFKDEMNWKEDEQRYRNIFGSTDEKGSVIFLDALPTGYPDLELDIMTPHFGKYYDGKLPPADYLTPVPIPFITIAPDSEFKFIYLSKNERFVNNVEKHLKEAIREGVGAKTAVGYGEMSEVIM